MVFAADGLGYSTVESKNGGQRMKSWLRSLIPSSILRAYHRTKQSRENRRNSNRSPEEVFTEIYREEKWGAGTGPFCSGTGSLDESITRPYVAAVCSYLRSFGGGKPHVVDLGCGDFVVGRQLVEDCGSYTGVDVVPELVQHHQASENDPRIRFQCLDIVRDELPPGDVCIIRQVLQHLSNDQIVKILSKLRQYRAVIITEHYPADRSAVVPNRDKVHGGGIRLFENSGVYLDQPPFNLPMRSMELMVEVPGHGFEKLYDPGVIRTYLISYSSQTSGTAPNG
jgi:hypothetical protein